MFVWNCSVPLSYAVVQIYFVLQRANFLVSFFGSSRAFSNWMNVLSHFQDEFFELVAAREQWEFILKHALINFSFVSFSLRVQPSKGYSLTGQDERTTHKACDLWKHLVSSFVVVFGLHVHDRTAFELRCSQQRQSLWFGMWMFLLVFFEWKHN